ncbi:MAG: UDP-N-acetylmuramoyl-L-alanyl-D-glutamate-2, 6-diaminopimelate ligase [Candidatus Moranbacteria bacterium GW2011_GWE2_35_2-]|nr:MAG: UDP-N-acetylmuramoyl-L-alanyl-D-glutamate-2, 6-diaminopimelate ligase [Candidatus Moranbacteria bacterium GW2011_GWE2_35_2-]KKQ06582.1 MAG: UDP-N-acetylmuramoyl-L-alanyl-D-glutamate-2, 6-diaminopimelate ligase [Candidatus Moranbacteria bacterium GW2011_GWF1_36_4]KKQ22469.1 MAG: UDP-N-acetylmuramoyl-L-alanyl-D-glutamate-2, 6-diaminopimelate ligase [Candidatus Moranbacteria bacterium GW2011_GWF2_37_11]KKQ29538.1 MAG: UDP-N-acetylmuramoyl-L-alanyl-D-glutamate-2, 6-diaminopimelate ligase [Ca
MKKIIPQKLKNYYHLLYAVVANFWYGFPSKKIKVIGVTGTNGKTTTVQMITKILEEAGFDVAMASTINFKLNGKEKVNKTKFTTLSAFAVQKFIMDAVLGEHDFVVLETSSHSLDQYRVWGVEYDTAVITNVTREHLDYHKTMEQYRKAKKTLFKKAENIVVNLDMEKPEYYLSADVEKKYGYSIENQESRIKNQDFYKMIKAENIKLDINKSEFIIHNSQFLLNLPGKFNIENALAATCVGMIYDIKNDVIARALEKINGIPGRMESVSNDRGLNIIIDYAVTPDSLEKLYRLIREFRNTEDGKIIAVFGSCGERDRGKRPIMGEIVSRTADYVIVTNEDPYGEDPQRIIDEVASGVKNKKENENFWKITDRRRAIKKALQIARPGDFVIVTGKGAEETMAVGATERISWSDKKIIREILQESM